MFYPIIRSDARESIVLDPVTFVIWWTCLELENRARIRHNCQVELWPKTWRKDHGIAHIWQIGLVC